MLNTSKHDTKFFDHGTTRGSKLRDTETRTERLESYTIAFMASAIIWFALAAIFSVLKMHFFCDVFIGVGLVTIVTWAFVVIPKKPFKDAFKWVVNWVCKPVKL